MAEVRTGAISSQTEPRISCQIDCSDGITEILFERNGKSFNSLSFAFSVYGQLASTISHRECKFGIMRPPDCSFCPVISLLLMKAATILHLSSGSCSA